MEYKQKERANEDSPYMNHKREYHRKLYAEKIKTSPEKMERLREYNRQYHRNKNATPEELERKRQYARDYAKKKREQCNTLNTNSSASSSYEDSEEMKPAEDTPQL